MVSLLTADDADQRKEVIIRGMETAVQVDQRKMPKRRPTLGLLTSQLNRGFHRAALMRIAGHAHVRSQPHLFRRRHPRATRRGRARGQCPL